MICYVLLICGLLGLDVGIVPRCGRKSEGRVVACFCAVGLLRRSKLKIELCHPHSHCLSSGLSASLGCLSASLRSSRILLLAALATRRFPRPGQPPLSAAPLMELDRFQRFNIFDFISMQLHKFFGRSEVDGRIVDRSTLAFVLQIHTLDECLKLCTLGVCVLTSLYFWQVLDYV